MVEANDEDQFDVENNNEGDEEWDQDGDDEGWGDPYGEEDEDPRE